MKPRSSLNLKSEAFTHYSKGDLHTFNSIVTQLDPSEWGSAANTDYIWQLVPDLITLFLRTNEKLLCRESIENGYLAPSVLVKVALQKAVGRNFNYAKKQYVLTTLLISAIIDSMDFYFDQASKKSKKAAFRATRKLIGQSFNFRKRITYYESIHDWENEPNLRGMAQYLKKVPNKKNVIVYGMGMLVLKIKFYCGTKSCARDLSMRHQIQKSLKKSKSMEEFVEFLIEKKTADVGLN